MAKRGRKPIEFDLKQVESYAARGLNQEQIADALGIHRSTLFANKAKSADFSDAIKRGLAKGLAIVTNKLFELVQEGNLGAICFFLKCRGGDDWKEKLSLQSDQQEKIKITIKEE